MSATTEEAFAPADLRWQLVSPKLTTARRLSSSGLLLVVVAVIVVLLLIPAVPTWVSGLVGALGVLGYGWAWWYFGRLTKSFRYVERADDLIVGHGFMFRRLVIVPYGRMQLVDLAAGPIDRAFGIVTLQLHTAAATSDASIPGLTPEIASALRDRLAKLGEQRAAGL
ncbi:MAG: PH domain-containing protein [Candidatus Nanopelagicales bacterium]